MNVTDELAVAQLDDSHDTAIVMNANNRLVRVTDTAFASLAIGILGFGIYSERHRFKKQ